MTAPRAMRDTPPPALPGPDADMIAYVEALLEQKPIAPDLRARAFSPEAAAARAAQAAAWREADWPALGRYRDANAALTARPDLVMIGDSLTEIWGLAMPELFGARVVNRGIAGQTSGQILLRFMADVVDLAPRRVHILCGGNDIAGNTGPTTPVDYQRNMRAMVALAEAADVEVILASLTPALDVPWNAEADARSFVPRLNRWLCNLAEERGLAFVDYHAPLADNVGGLRPAFSADGVHVTRAAYRVMLAELEAVIGSVRHSTE